ncbi:hypothetical protein GCM10011571_31850 [Marinithermofilum abyssi]|uniref:TIGR04086 family membrane protein n=1 Tax=Marinithermofilum abyssi TaxID=1571185 RepID=A0A8J2VJ99_9BACL|nr:TIGR04086 family membrane protein [Marinithermofilum abyssi]GGE27272.1 hypothetical protein GCM10011571_31850 [Marinithermofilum abyssi]
MKETSAEKWNPITRNPMVGGVTLILAVVLAGSVITALLLRFSTISESTLPYFTYGINAAALLSGGWVSGRKAGRRGWLYGGLTGLVYVLLIFIIGFLAFDTAMRVQPALLLICATSLSALGGVFGVNTGNPLR